MASANQYSLLLINHEHEDVIAQDPWIFWKNAQYAIKGAESVSQPFGMWESYPVATAVCLDVKETSLRLILTNGMQAETLAHVPSMAPVEDALAQEAILREAAKKLGFRLHRIPKKRRKSTDGT